VVVSWPGFCFLRILAGLDFGGNVLKRKRWMCVCGDGRSVCGCKGGVEVLHLVYYLQPVAYR